MTIEEMEIRRDDLDVMATELRKQSIIDDSALEARILYWVNREANRYERKIAKRLADCASWLCGRNICSGPKSR